MDPIDRRSAGPAPTFADGDKIGPVGSHRLPLDRDHGRPQHALGLTEAAKASIVAAACGVLRPFLGEAFSRFSGTMIVAPMSATASQ